MLKYAGSTQAKGFHLTKPKGLKVIDPVIDLVIAMSIISTLLALVIPSYALYTSRSDLAMATEILSDLNLRMQENHSLNGTYRINAGEPACAIRDFVDGQFSFNCNADLGENFVWTTSTTDGNNPYLSIGYEYTIDQDGHRQTTLFGGRELSPAVDDWKFK
jgi:type II secretory pathway pseudopilin PulG